jgi:hypothetical protein
MKKLILFATIVFALSTGTFAQTAAEWNKQGVELAKKYQYKEAFTAFTKAIELKADFAEAYYNRAVVWFELPANSFPNSDGCADLKKAKELGFKVKDSVMKDYGCL